MDSLIWIVAIGAISAGFVQGLSGFAFGLVAMSIWAWSVDPQLAAVLAVFGALIGQIVAAFSVRRGFSMKLMLPFLIGGLIGIPIGVMILPRLNVDLFKAVLGAFLVIWCPFMLFARRLPRFADYPLVDGTAGLLGGIMGGIGGFSGAVPTLWCTLRGMDKDTQRAIIQNFNLVVQAVTLTSYLATGMVTVDMLPMFGIVAAAVLIPVLLGAKLYLGISEAAFRRIVLTLLTLSGLALLASSLPRLL